MQRSLKSFTAISTFALAVGLVGSHPAFAQTGPAASPAQADASQTSDQTGGVGDIIVTAQKRSESINNIPISITAVTGDALAERGITNTADLTKVVAGFNFTRSNYGTPVYSLRGVGFYDTSLAASPTVSVYIDEVPLPFSIMTRGAALDLERVEVLKGPQGTLFGQNSTGGAINYIAAKPTADLRAGIDVGYSRFDRFEAQAFVSGPISDSLKYRLAVRRESGGAWQRSTTRDDELGATNLTIARLLLDWEPSSQFSVNINVNGWWDRSDSQAGQLIGFFGNPAAYPLVSAQPFAANNARAADWDAGTSPRRHDNFGQGSMRINYEIADEINLTSISSYEHLTIDSSTDADGTAAQDYRGENTGKLETFNQELRLDGRMGEAVRWVVGGNYEHDRTDDFLLGLTRDSRLPFDSSLATNLQRTKTYAVFANADWTFAPGLTLQGGARYTDQNRDFQGCLFDTGTGDLAAIQGAAASRLVGTTVAILPGGCTTLAANNRPALVSTSLNQSNVSWRAALNWKVAPSQLLYATISRGFKNGSFPTAGATRDVGLAPAVQESLLAYEAGFKLGLFNRTMQLNGAAFYYDYTNKQIRGRRFDPLIGPQNALVNIPESRVYGAELQLNWEPVDSLRLNGALTYTNSKIKGEFINFNVLGQQGDFTGQAFPLTPKWQITGGVEYRQPLGRLTGFAGADTRYQSKSNSGLGNLELFDIKSYASVDLRVGVRAPNSNWSATAFVNNATNIYTWNSVVFVIDTIVRYANPPRTWGVRLGYRY